MGSPGSREHRTDQQIGRLVIWPTQKGFMRACGQVALRARRDGTTRRSTERTTRTRFVEIRRWGVRDADCLMRPLDLTSCPPRPALPPPPHRHGQFIVSNPPYMKQGAEAAAARSSSGGGTALTDRSNRRAAKLASDQSVCACAARLARIPSHGAGGGRCAGVRQMRSALCLPHHSEAGAEPWTGLLDLPSGESGFTTLASARSEEPATP